MIHRNQNRVKLISSDLNGTLVHQHTMTDMIRIYLPHAPERYEKAQEVFSRQTAGRLSMREAFAQAGPLTQGLALRHAIEYVQTTMRFLHGFDEFVTSLYEHGIHFVINSTGYTVTTDAIKALFGHEKFFHVICNNLIFAWEGDPLRTISPGELSMLVKAYFTGQKDEPRYDVIRATGEVVLGIADESKKASLLFDLADSLGIPRGALVHIGDTMGDSAGIADVARSGGTGIAFNYNEPLRKYLVSVLEKEKLPGKIIFIDPKGPDSDLRHLLPILIPH